MKGNKLASFKSSGQVVDTIFCATQAATSTTVNTRFSAPHHVDYMVYNSGLNSDMPYKATSQCDLSDIEPDNRRDQGECKSSTLTELACVFDATHQGNIRILTVQ